VETRLKGYKYFEIERDFFNKLGVPIDGDFKFGKDKLLKFFKLVQDGKFPLNNIASELFLDIVEWFDKDESRQMRYSPSTLQFVGLGRKIFGGLFIRINSLQKTISI
jgi:hypothetical protein